MALATETNWAGNFAYSAGTLHRPTSVEQLMAIVRAAPHVHVLGSRHTFNAIADSAELITLADMPQDVTIAANQRTVTVPANATYGALAQQLEPGGLALHNLASLPHVSIGGAVATGTHGSGDGNGNLATAVAGLELMTSDGELERFARGDPDFDGVVVNLGALGAVVRLTLDVVPTYQVCQTVFERLSWRARLDNFDAVTRGGYSVSLFTSWGDVVEQVWVKSHVTGVAAAGPADGFFGATAAAVDVHPLPGEDARSCTEQLGRPGGWWQRLPHFRLEFNPGAGDELQSEYMVERTDAPAAIEAVRGLAERIRPLLMMSEIRTVAADALWMSPEYGRDTVCLHFTWHPQQAAVEALLVDLEAALAPFNPRPHWGKLFAMRAEAIAPLYPRLADFVRLKHRLDPRGAFTNPWLADNVLGR